MTHFSVNISQAFAWVAEELRRQYSLGYYPKAAGREGRRQLKVEVGRPELVVQARDSYVYAKKKEGTKEDGGRQPKDADEQPRRLDGNL